MSRSNGPLGQVRGAAPQQWQQQPADLDPAVQQAYAAAQAAAQPRYPQQGFGNVQGQPQYAPQPQSPVYATQPGYQQPMQPPPSDQGYYSAAPVAPQTPQQSYQPVFDRYSPPADAGQRGYDPRMSQSRPQQPAQPVYAPAPPAAQPSLYDSHAQPRGSVYDQWPQPDAQAAPAPSARGYDFSNYMPNTPAPQPGGHQAVQQPVRRPAAPQHYAEPQHEEPQWQAGSAPGQADPYAARPEAYEQQQYPAEQSGQLQNAVDQGYDDHEVPDYEEDEPRRSRRGLVMVSALVGAIALGGGLAYAYKKFVKPGGDGTQVAKVQAPKGPAKTQPADPGGKQFPNQDSKLQNRLDGSTANAPNPDVDGGVKRVQTYPVGRDGTVSAPPAVPGMFVVPPQAPAQPVVQAALEAPPAAAVPIAVAPPQPPLQPRAITPQPRAAIPVVNAAPAEPIAAAPPAPKKQALKKAPATRDDLVASAAGSVPAAAPIAAAPSKLGGGGYVAVLASKASKADAERANADMEQRFDVLKGKIFDVQEANLSAQGKGVVFRSVVGPPGSLAYASGICGQLKAVGHTDCWPVKY